jgi:hypothetical protein
MDQLYEILPLLRLYGPEQTTDLLGKFLNLLLRRLLL